LRSLIVRTIPGPCPGSNAPSPIQIGERVAYSRVFLQKINALTGDLPFARGVVEEITELGAIRLARFTWNREGTPERVNVANLAADCGKGIIDRYERVARAFS